MRKSFNKAICLLVVTLLLFSALAGCGSKQGTNETESTTTQKTTQKEETTSQQETEGNELPIADQKVTYTYMVVEHPSKPFKDTFVVVPELAKRTNVELEIMPVPNDGWQQKYGVVMASGDIPDFMYFQNDYNTINNFGPKGLFSNILEYTNVMPNFTSLMGDISEIGDYKVSKDELYTIPIDFSPITQTTVTNRIFMIRQDVLKDNNLSQPKTYDELYQTLKELKKIYPDYSPWINRNGLANLLDVMMTSWGMPTESYNNYTYLDSKTNKWNHAMLNGNFKSMMDFIVKCYNEGLLDQEFSLMSANQWEERLLNNKAFFTLDWNNRTRSVTNAAVKAGDENFYLGPMPVPESGVEGALQKVMGKNRVGKFIAMSKGIKQPEVAAKFLDYWLYSEEGSLLTWRGIDGKTTIIDYDNKKTIPHPDINSEFYPDAKLNNTSDFGVGYDGFKAINVEYFGWTFDRSSDELYQDVVNKYHVSKAGVTPPPVLILTDEEREQERELLVNLTDFINIEITKFIMGERPMSEWSDFVDQLKKKDVEKLLALYDAAQARK